MSHLRADELLRWRDQPEDADRARVVAHLAACATCTAAYAELVRSRPAEHPPAVLQPAVFAARGRVRTSERPRARRQAWRLAPLAAAVAIAVALVVPRFRDVPPSPAPPPSSPEFHDLAPTGRVAGPPQFRWRARVRAARYRVEVHDADRRLVWRDDVAVPPRAVMPLRTLPDLESVTIYEITMATAANRYPPDAKQLTTRLPDPLSDANSDFTYYDDEHYDVFYSDADGAFDPDGGFLTVEGVWRPGRLHDRGGMNINEVELRFGGAEPRSRFGDFVTSFVMGSTCDPGFDLNCIPGSHMRAVDHDLETFPRFGQTSALVPSDRFRLTIGFDEPAARVPAPASLSAPAELQARLRPGTEYRWRVVALDAKGATVAESPLIPFVLAAS